MVTLTLHDLTLNANDKYMSIVRSSASSIISFWGWDRGVGVESAGDL